MAYIDEENYHDKAIATQQGRQVVQKWSELSDLLIRHQVLLVKKLGDAVKLLDFINRRLRNESERRLRNQLTI